LKACEITTREGDGICNERMVGRRGQSCNVAGGGECAIADEVSAWDASGVGIGIETLEISG
jgi:hypothetical protein